MLTSVLCIIAAMLLAFVIANWATGIIGDDLLAPLLDQLLGTTTSPVTVTARLFTNNITPAVGDVIGNYTEATFTGYAPVSLTGWSAASVASHIGSTTASNATFTITAGTQNIYGVYFTEPGGSPTKLYGAVRDPSAPVALDAANTNTYIISPSLTDQSA